MANHLNAESLSWTFFPWFLDRSNTQTYMHAGRHTHIHAWKLAVWVLVLPAALYHNFREQCCQLHLISSSCWSFSHWPAVCCQAHWAISHLEKLSRLPWLYHCLLFLLQAKKKPFFVHLCCNVLHLNNRCLSGVLVGTHWCSSHLTFPLAGNIYWHYLLLNVLC